MVARIGRTDVSGWQSLGRHSPYPLAVARNEATSSAPEASLAPVVRAAARRPLCLPTVLLAIMTALVTCEGASPLARHGQLGHTLAAARVELVGPSVLAVVLVTLVCERLWPAERRRLLARGHVQDACYLLVFAGAVVPLVTLLGVASAHLLLGDAAWLRAPWASSWPRWLALSVTLVAMDGCNWLTHWADHRVAVLWRVHALHHSQEELSVLTTFRTHPLVHTVSFLAAAVPVVAVMGARPLAPVLITAYLCLGALPHANVRWTFGPLGRILVSPAYHRIHHAADGPYDVNLGIVLTVWDVLAHRAIFPRPAQAPCRTGLADRPLPVEQASKRRPARLLCSQLLDPFLAPRGATRPRSPA